MANKRGALSNLATQPAPATTPGSYPTYSGNAFDTLAQGNPMGNYDTHNAPILHSPVWNEAVEGAMKRTSKRKTRGKVGRKL